MMQTLRGAAGAVYLLGLVTGGPALADTAIEEVVVSATALRATVQDAVQPVAVISGADLQHDMASSIGETLAGQPGVTGTYFGPRASRPVIRGLGGERVQVLEDSIGSLDVSSLSEDHAVSVEDLLAEQIEIVKGPAALLYGSGAVGGVVNLITRRVPEQRPADGLGGAGELRGASVSGERAVVGRLDAGVGALALHADGFDHDSGDIRVPGFAWTPALREAVLAADPDAELVRERIPNTDTRSTGGAVGASWIGARGFVGYGYSRFDTNYGTAQSPEDYAAGTGARIDMGQRRHDLKAELRGTEGGWFQALRLRAARNEYQHAEVELDGHVAVVFRQTGSELRAALDHEVGALRGTLGVQYRELDFRAGGEEEPLVPDSLSRQSGLFAFEQYHHDPLTLEAGLRIERGTIAVASATGFGDYSGTATSASLGALWKFPAEVSLAANLTRSRRHPAALELYADGVHEATGQYIVGRPDLRPETAQTLDLVVRGNAGAPWQLSLWLSHFRDFIYLSPAGATQEDLPVFDYEQRNARLWGAEAQLQFALWRAGPATLGLNLLGDYVRGTVAGGDNLPAMPPWRVGCELEYDRAPWHVALNVQRFAAQRQLAAFETPTAGYIDVALDVGLRQPLRSATLSWFLKLANLADAVERRHSSPLKDYAPLPARSLGAGVRVEF